MLFNGLEGKPSLIYLFRCLWAAGLLNLFFQPSLLCPTLRDGHGNSSYNIRHSLTSYLSVKFC